MNRDSPNRDICSGLRDAVTSFRQCRWSSDSAMLKAVRDIRKFISRYRGTEDAIDEVIRSGVISDLIGLLSQHGNQSASADLNLELAWILTNIASGRSDQTMAVVEAGAIEPLTKMLNNCNWGTETGAALVEQTIWALGNIMGDGTFLRDKVMAAGIFPTLMLVLEQFTSNQDANLALRSESLLRNSLWALGNVFRYGAPDDGVPLAKTALIWIKERLLNFWNDQQTLCSLLWATSYILVDGQEYIQLVIDLGLARPLLNMLFNDDAVVVNAGTWVTRRLFAGTPQQKDILLSVRRQLWQRLSALIDQADTKVQNGAIITLSVILTNALSHHVQAVIDVDLMVKLAGIIRHGTYRIRHSAISVALTMIDQASSQQIEQLVNQGAIAVCCRAVSAMRRTDIRIQSVQAALKILETAHSKVDMGSIPVDKPIEPVRSGEGTEKHTAVGSGNNPFSLTIDEFQDGYRSQLELHYIQLFHTAGFIRKLDNILQPCAPFILHQLIAEVKLRFFDDAVD